MRSIFLLLLLISISFCKGQRNPILSKELEIKKLENNEFKLIITLNIQNGWELVYSCANDSGWPQAKINLFDTSDVHLVGNLEVIPVSKLIIDPIFKERAKVNSGRAMYMQNIKLKGANHPIINGEMVFMMFTDDGKIALPPWSLYFTAFLREREPFIYGN